MELEEARKQFREQDKHYARKQQIIMNEILKREETYLETNEVDEVPDKLRMRWIHELIKAEELHSEHIKLLQARMKLERVRGED